MAKIKYPFRVLTPWPYGGGEPDHVEGVASFRAALKKAVSSARAAGKAEITKVVSVSPWRSKRLAECRFVARNVDRTNPRYGRMRHLNNAVCKLTPEGEKLIAASKARRRKRG